MEEKLKNGSNNIEFLEINKNWFYKLSEFSSSNLYVKDWVELCIYDDTSLEVNIKVWKNSKLDYFAFYYDEASLSKNIISNWDESEVNINTLFLSKNNKITSKVYWAIFANNCKMYMNLLAFAMENWDLEVDWIFEIGKSLDNTKWFLDEENIFLWDNAKIKALPKLFVESNDIEAWHACKMERISDEKLFYLRSRWIWKQNALNMIIDAKISDLFWKLSKIDNTFYESLKENILEKIA